MHYIYAIWGVGIQHIPYSFRCFTVCALSVRGRAGPRGHTARARGPRRARRGGRATVYTVL